MEEPHSSRFRDLQDLMVEKGIDLAILSPGTNMRYLTALKEDSTGRHLLLGIPCEGEPEFFASEIERSKIDDTGIESSFWSTDDDLLESLESFLGKFPADTVALEDKMWEAVSSDIREVLGDSELHLASELMDELRAVKDEEELERLTEASRIADRALKDVMDTDILGMKEVELVRFIEERMDEHGGCGTSFDTIVASGPNTARPHHESSERTISGGDPVMLDFGCWYEGYASDQTRTFVAGEDRPPDEFMDVFGTVLEAQRKGVSSVRPGMSGQRIDEIVRGVVEREGFADGFIHRTGHGVGLEVHESPKIPPKGHEKAMSLRPGMVFSIEPGVYIEDDFGVRIEDLVVVTEDGCERLNKTKRELL